MSSLLTSLFFDPVVRQARRLSNTPPHDVNPRHLQSHAKNTTASAAHIPSEQPLYEEQRRQTAITDEQIAATNNLGYFVFDRFVPLLSSQSRPSSVSHVQHHQERTHINDVDEDLVASRDVPVDHIATANTDHEEKGIDDVEDEKHKDMPPNAPHIMSSRARPVSNGSSPTSPRSSRSSTLRRLGARNVLRPEVTAGEPSASSSSSSLPADDGMRMLRQRIHEIRELSESSEDKAQRMHHLMTADWQAAQALLMRSANTASLSSPDRPLSANSASSKSTSTSTQLAATAAAPCAALLSIDPLNPYHIEPEDLQPSYCLSADFTESPTDTSQEEDVTPFYPTLGCKHYKRNVKIQCHDCKKWYPCRHCHDSDQPTHTLNRRATENMLCMVCLTPQAAGQWCQGCGERGAWYYCDTCKLWDDDSTKSIYHCHDCGICRRGEGIGKDFSHCKKCNVCVSISHYPTHTCIENATASNCPLCLEYMFTSSHEIVAMPCGHYLHHHCYSQLMLSSYQCPICKRSAVNMETQWRKLEEEIRRQPMPVEFSEARMDIRCNDCGGRSVVGFHWLGCRCAICDGFNTVEVKLIADGDVVRDVEDFASARREQVEVEQLNGALDIRPRVALRTLSVRPYFQEIGEHEIPERPSSARSGDSGFGLPSMPSMPSLNPYEMLARVGRGLSPMRHLVEATERLRGTTVDGDQSEWVDEGDWFVSSGSDEDSDDEEEEDRYEDSEEEGDFASEGELNLELLGHR